MKELKIIFLHKQNANFSIHTNQKMIKNESLSQIYFKVLYFYDLFPLECFLGFENAFC
jgi:hypothetical protein